MRLAPALLAATLALATPVTSSNAQAKSPLDPATEALSHSIFKQLVEINTTDSVGSVTAAAEAMQKRLLDAGFAASDLTLAGPNASHAQVINKLRGLKAYNGNGLLPQTINYSTIFGHDLPQACYWIMQAKPQGFVLTNPTPTCGHDIPGTSTANAS